MDDRGNTGRNTAREPGLAELSAAEDRPPRIAVVADGVGPASRLGELLVQLRARRVRGYEIELLGTRPDADRRVRAADEMELPLCPGLRLGVPSLFAVAEALIERRYDLLHVCAPAPAAVIAMLMANVARTPVAVSFNEDLLLGADADPGVAALLRGYYDQCRVVLSPSAAADASLGELGIDSGRIARWQPGVDLQRFSPSRYCPHALPDGVFNVLHVGALSRTRATELLAEAFLIAHDRAPRLHLVLAGCGSVAPQLRARLGNAATAIAACDHDALARAYAGADLLVVCDETAACDHVILEAQASGLPVLAVDAGAPCELIDSGRSGCLVPADPEALAGALRWLARRRTIRDRLASGGMRVARARTWEQSLAQLAGAWARAIDGRAGVGEVARAA